MLCYCLVRSTKWADLPLVAVQYNIVYCTFEPLLYECKRLHGQNLNNACLKYEEKALIVNVD